MNSVILIGFMATGKTVVGKLLAERLGYKFVDTDQQIERFTRKTIPQIFAEDGEPEFRRLERELLHWLIHYDKVVISTGGGMIKNPDNLKKLKQMGKMICLTAQPEVILARIKDKPHRPLLHTPNPLSRIKQLLTSREPYYSQADCTMDTSQFTPEEVVKRIIKWLDRKSRRNTIS